MTAENQPVNIRDVCFKVGYMIILKPQHYEILLRKHPEGCGCATVPSHVLFHHGSCKN